MHFKMWQVFPAPPREQNARATNLEYNELKFKSD